MKNLVVAITTITSTLSGETVHPEPPVHYICFFVDGTENQWPTLFTIEEAVHPDPLFLLHFFLFQHQHLFFLAMLIFKSLCIVFLFCR